MRTGEDLLGSLNNEQRNAVQCTEGPLVVLAGAGTGKTKVISSRIAYLLRIRVPAWQILAVTFTRKAALEMKTRVEELVGPSAQGLTVSTFHSLAFRILRELKPGAIKVIEEKAQLELAERLLWNSKVGLDADRLLSQISWAKSHRFSPTDIRSKAKDAEQTAFADCYAAYQENLRQRRLIDFDDMITAPLELLQKDAAVRERYQRRWRYILVDEYQDTNGTQYDFMRAILSPRSNICVVGDDDQSIYAFRGANAGRILSFKEDFRNSNAVALETNYRSHAEIIDLANAIISRAPNRYPKRLISSLGPGGSVLWNKLEHEHAESIYIEQKIKALIWSKKFYYRDIALMTRVASLADFLYDSLRRAYIPCVLGKNSSGENRLSVMTLHQAKGLEFPAVFVPALEEEMLPHHYSLKSDEAAIEEERRLLYVAVTRAKKMLYLTSCGNRERRPRKVSRFLVELRKQNFRLPIDSA